MVLGKLPVPGRPTIWITVGHGPIALAVGAGGGCLEIFTLFYPYSTLSPSLWETARYRLKYCLKGPLNPEQPTNQAFRLHQRSKINNKNTPICLCWSLGVLWGGVSADFRRFRVGRGGDKSRWSRAAPAGTVGLCLAWPTCVGPSTECSFIDTMKLHSIDGPTRVGCAGQGPAVIVGAVCDWIHSLFLWVPYVSFFFSLSSYLKLSEIC